VASLVSARIRCSSARLKSWNSSTIQNGKGGVCSQLGWGFRTSSSAAAAEELTMFRERDCGISGAAK
jgi:hypothetical protein